MHPANLVKLTVFLTDMDYLTKVSRRAQPLLRNRCAAGRTRGDAG
jgi:hypothetical protein